MVVSLICTWLQAVFTTNTKQGMILIKRISTYGLLPWQIQDPRGRRPTQGHLWEPSGLFCTFTKMTIKPNWWTWLLACEPSTQSMQPYSESFPRMWVFHGMGLGTAFISYFGQTNHSRINVRVTPYAALAIMHVSSITHANKYWYWIRQFLAPPQFVRLWIFEYFTARTTFTVCLLVARFTRDPKAQFNLLHSLVFFLFLFFSCLPYLSKIDPRSTKKIVLRQLALEK